VRQERFDLFDLERDMVAAQLPRQVRSSAKTRSAKIQRWKCESTKDETRRKTPPNGAAKCNRPEPGEGGENSPSKSTLGHQLPIRHTNAEIGGLQTIVLSFCNTQAGFVRAPEFYPREVQAMF
jgi:hypothetical protein